MKLINKTAIVTGGSRGLGREIVKHFLEEGANVAICARTEEDVAKTLQDFRDKSYKGAVYGCAADVSNLESVCSFVKFAMEKLGNKVDCLVNNAGIYGPKGNIDIVNIDKWIYTFNVNVMGVVYLCREIIPIMKLAGGGKIINLSGGGATNPLPGVSAYAATKAAVVRLTETLSLECNPYNISVNAVAPGALNTGMLEELLSEGDGLVDPIFFQKAMKQKETGGTPLDKGASLCVYLASDESKGITGKLISAVWDNWSELHNDIKALSPDVYTLRRIVPEDR